MGKTFPCPKCDFVAKWDKILKDHKKRKHGVVSLHNASS
jgi:hypothetical protein